MIRVTLSKTLASSVKTPNRNSFSLFFDMDNKLKFKDSDGVVHLIGGDIIVDISGKLDKITDITPSAQLYAKRPNGTQYMIDVDLLTGNNIQDIDETKVLNSSNINGDIVSLTLGSPALINRRFDVFLNGVLIQKELITHVNSTNIQVDFTPLDVDPQIDDIVVIKYIIRG